MYHADQAHIITTDDITKLHALSLTTVNGKTFASFVAELQPDKVFNETDGQFRLHLTNGVSHRYLVPEPVAVSADEEAPPEERGVEEKSPEDNPDELAVAPITHAARKQHKKG